MAVLCFFERFTISFKESRSWHLSPVEEPTVLLSFYVNNFKPSHSLLDHFIICIGLFFNVSNFFYPIDFPILELSLLTMRHCLQKLKVFAWRNDSDNSKFAIHLEYKNYGRFHVVFTVSFYRACYLWKVISILDRYVERKTGKNIYMSFMLWSSIFWKGFLVGVALSILVDMPQYFVTLLFPHTLGNI